MAAARTKRGLDRLVNFSDATVAIAITLLILPLVDLATEANGDELGAFFSEHVGALISFGVTFVVIGRFWAVHHSVFEYAIDYDQRLINVNLLWLASIVFLPFVANIQARSSGEPGISALYIGTMIVTSAAAGGIDWLLIHTPGLGDPETIGRLRISSAVVFTGLLAVALVIAVVFPVINLWALLVLLARPVILRHWRRRARGAVLDG
jgi:uncharacterized membrane protein